MKKVTLFFYFAACFFLTSCGFHLQGNLVLAPPMHRLYIQSPDPYSYLIRKIDEYLRISKVLRVSSPDQADVILTIISDDATQELLTVNGTNQTRQYNLQVIVTFMLSKADGAIILGPQTLSETRPLTVQANQILGSNNEANLFYQQMRRTIAYGIMNRISSREVTNLVNKAFQSPQSTAHETKSSATRITSK